MFSTKTILYLISNVSLMSKCFNVLNVTMFYYIKIVLSKKNIFNINKSFILIYIYILRTFTFTFSHLADAFIQSDLQLWNT